MSDPVQAQYETYPYPPRDPRDEAKRLVVGSPSHILEIDHYVFGGRRDFTQPLRALFAGGGTGDGTTMLAQQLADFGCPAEIVHLDLSTAARGIAEARVKARGLANVSFVTGSLLEMSAMGLGRFDYIDCCGVLHHLEDPAAGLAALEAALEETGGIGLMVYGALGRTGVYQIQEALRLLDPPAAARPTAARIELARRLLRQLPPTNWFARNQSVGDHLAAGDAGVYDLLLHSRDRAYTVPELAALVAGAGLAITGFISPWRYEPANYLSDATLLRQLAGLDSLSRASLAELLAGNLKTHVCYVVRANRADSAVARPDGPDVVPVLIDDDGTRLAARLKPGGALAVRIDGIEGRFALPRRAGPILARIDGKRRLDEIHRDLVAVEGAHYDWASLAADFERVYAVFNGANKLFLRRPLAGGS